MHHPFQRVEASATYMQLLESNAKLQTHKMDEAGRVLSSLQLGLLWRPCPPTSPFQSKLPRTTSSQVSPLVETPHTLWATCVSVWPPSQEKSVFLCSNGISCVLTCAQCLLHCQWALRRNACLPLPYIPPVPHLPPQQAFIHTEIQWKH